MIDISKSFRPKEDELEKTILGTVLSIGRLSSARRLKPQQFKDMRNRFIFEIMADLETGEQATDYSNVADRLKSKGIESDYLERLRDYGTNEAVLVKLVELLKECNIV